MELKDVILSTLAEMEDIKPEVNNVDNSRPEDELKVKIKKELKIVSETQSIQEEEQSISGEMPFLKSMRERLLVLFEGFQAPNNTNIEAKVDMTLNFLEYVLVTIDSRIEEIERGSHK